MPYFFCPLVTYCHCPKASGSSLFKLQLKIVCTSPHPTPTPLLLLTAVVLFSYTSAQVGHGSPSSLLPQVGPGCTWPFLNRSCHEKHTRSSRSVPVAGPPGLVGSSCRTFPALDVLPFPSQGLHLPPLFSLHLKRCDFVNSSSPRIASSGE